MRYLKRQSIIILVGIFLIFGALVSGVVQAQDVPPPKNTDVIIQTEIIIPGSEPVFDGGLMRGRVGGLANYLSIIYNFLISIVGVVAGVFILVGGFQYLTAGGDASRVTSAKKRISNALIGMILALSSFVLLNTINPELVNLKLPALTKVETEISFFPWCENVASEGLIKEGTEVLPTTIMNGTSCGSVGKFAPAEGLGEQFCIYRGNDCSRFSNGAGTATRSTCMQKNTTRPEMEKNVASGNTNFDEMRGAECLACWQLSRTKKKTMGFGGGENACNLWEKLANITNLDTGSRERVKKDSGGADEVVAYCGYSNVHDSCVQSDLNCKTVYKNKDDYTWATNRDYKGVLSNFNPFDSDSPDCQGYDEGSSNIVWITGGVGNEKIKVSGDAKLEDYPSHLNSVCKANPCNYNSSRGGCFPDPGIIQNLKNKVTIGGTGVEDCGNKGRPNGIADSFTTL